MPANCKLCTPIQNKVAIAESTADPSLFSISLPILEHIGESLATAPRLFFKVSLSE